MASDMVPKWAGDTARAELERANDRHLKDMIAKKHDAEMQRAMDMGALATSQAGIGIGTQAPYTGLAQGAQGRKPTPQGRFTDGNMYSMLASRMGWNLVTASPPFDKCVPCKVTEEKAAVFIVTGGKAITIEDDLNLFPSDALITQLRLLEP
jgi:hypothetical protein